MNYEQFSHTIDGKEKSIFLVNMTQEVEHFFSTLAQRGIGKYLREGKKIGIIVNKKGYSNGVICHDCGFVPQCKRCSVSIHYHKLPGGNDQIGLCHICKTQYNYPSQCDHCGSQRIKPFGMGTQKVAEYLKQEFGADSLIIESETANSDNKIKKIRDMLNNTHTLSLNVISASPAEGLASAMVAAEIQAGISRLDSRPSSATKREGQQSTQIQQYPVLIGTSLLTTPIPEYPLDLVIFLNADMGLNIPDYNTAEKNFNLLYEAFTKHKQAQFIVQTFNPEQYSIRCACKLDTSAFVALDHEYRKAHNYPPFADLCVILYKNEVEEKVFAKVDKLHKELLYLKEKYGLNDLEIYSTPPLIYKIFGKYRYNIILKGKDLKNFMDIVFTKLNLVGKQFKVDWKADSIV